MLDPEYYCACKLEKEKKFLSIRSSWVKSLNTATNMKNGVRRGIPYRIFYSTDEVKPPDFSLQIRDAFVENMDSCYMAYVYTTFGK